MWGGTINKRDGTVCGLGGTNGGQDVATRAAGGMSTKPLYKRVAGWIAKSGR